MPKKALSFFVHFQFQSCFLEIQFFFNFTNDFFTGIAFQV